MDRRKFLTASGTALAGVSAAALGSGNRLFGVPNSVTGTAADSIPHSVYEPHLLKLHLAIAGVPASNNENYEAFAQVADDIITNPVTANAFTADPVSYLAAAGFKNIDVDKNSYQFKLVTALANPVLRNAARSGDTVSFLNSLQAQGFVSPDLLPPPCSSRSCTSTIVEVRSVAFVIAAVVLIVAAAAFAVVDADPASQSAVEQMALISGGKSFARDVVKQIAGMRADDLIQAINEGRVQIPAGLSKDETIASIKTTLAAHFP
jgi:hypothetical protein